MAIEEPDLKLRGFRGTGEVRSGGEQRSVRNLQSDRGREARPYLEEEG